MPNNTPKESLVNGNVTTLTPVCEALGDGLKQGPRPCDWDPEIDLYGPNEWSEYGVIDGWMWATDNSTALIEKSEKYADLDDSRAAKGKAVVAMCTRDFPAPLYVVEVQHVLAIGGVGNIPGLGLLDLDRLRDAITWAAGDAAKVVLALDEQGGGPLLRIAGPDSRVAVVIGMKPKEGTEDYWRPTIDLPLAEARP